MPSRGPKRGWKCYAIPAFSGIPNAKRGEHNQNWLPNLCLLDGPKEGGQATPPCILGDLQQMGQCRGIPTPSAFSTIKSGSQQRGAKSEVVASLVPSQGPKRGWKCDVTSAFSRVPNKEEQILNWSPTKGNKITSGCLNPTLSGAHKKGRNATSPLQIGDPQRQERRAKSEVAASPLLSRGPSGGRKCYVTPAFLVIPRKEGKNQKWLPHPCLLKGPKEGRNARSPLQPRASATKGNKIRSGCLTPAFLAAQKRAEMLRHPCVLGDPQRTAQGAKSEVVASPLPSQGPTRGRKCYVTPAFSSVPNKGEKNQKWLPHPCPLEAPKEDGNATAPLHSWGSPTPSAGSKIRSGPQQRGTKSEVATSPLPSQGPKRQWKCYVTPAFSSVPNKGEQNRKWSPTKGRLPSPL